GLRNFGRCGIERWRYLACGVHRLEDSERGRTVRAADEPSNERDGWRGPVGKRRSDPSSLGKHVYLHYGNGRLSARRWIGCACARGRKFCVVVCEVHELSRRDGRRRLLKPDLTGG